MTKYLNALCADGQIATSKIGGFLQKIDVNVIKT